MRIPLTIVSVCALALPVRGRLETNLMTLGSPPDGWGVIGSVGPAFSVRVVVVSEAARVRRPPDRSQPSATKVARTSRPPRAAHRHKWGGRKLMWSPAGEAKSPRRGLDSDGY